MNSEEAKNSYVSRFADLERRIVGDGSSWTAEIRRAALARFAALGFPTTRDEEWRYTSVEPIVRVPFAPGATVEDGVGARVKRLSFGGLPQNQLVFVNGRFAPRLSRLSKTSKGVVAQGLAAAMTDHRAEVEAHWARYTDYRQQSFVALNTALAEDGAFVFVPDGAAVEAPIHLVFVATAPEEPAALHPRTLIVLQRGSRATVVETYAGLDGSVYFTNGVTEISLGDGAVMDHYKVQLESERAFHVATQQVRIGRDGNFSSHSIAVGSALARNDVNVVLDGEGGDCTLNGLYTTGGRQHIDNHTRIDHQAPRCASRELYKGIMGGKSRGVFNGKIYVHKAAEKTDARQTNRNLLLSEEAWIDTKPQLEIYNNDVKCSHGSTIGQLDEAALFYLRARGIDLRAAIGLLTRGFAVDVTSRIKSAPVAGWVEKILEEKLDSIAAEEGKL